jgi:cytochrome P450
MSFVRFALAMQDSLIAGFDKTAFQEGVVERKFLWFRHFLINDPDGIRHVLVTHVDNYRKADLIRPMVVPALGNGLVTSEGETWRWHRRLMAPAFSLNSVSDYFEPMLAAIDDLIRRWEAHVAHEPIRLDDEMMALMLQIIARTMFSSDSDVVADVMARASREYQERIRLSPIALIPGINRLWAAQKKRQGARIVKALDQIIYSLIERRKTATTPARNPDLLERLIFGEDAKTGRKLSPTEIRDQVVTIFMAGHETTALALTWAWYLLSKHPEAERKFHDEVDSVLGARPLCYGDIAKLPYTSLVFDEALRLYPPVHSLAWRQAAADDEICGRKIPAGSLVGIVPWVVHRHQKLWERPDTFDPGRFEKDQAASRSRYSYIPYSAGPRVCIGGAFAAAEGVLTLAALGRKFRIEVVDDQALEPKGLLTLHPAGGIKARLRLRQFLDRSTNGT